ncbi:Leukocyte surface antigen CD53 [Oryzias melastigma]|uniref:Tetraspanin n=1 Tax=Oryzias melastigma TaxID=30732 RepID=A0A834C731_ORYME|nr:Leukocyte surface antigen CD53 [Oryzias melastigma]
MAQGCLKCLKYTMCISNFLCFMCGVALMGLGGYLMATFKVDGLIPSLDELSIPNLLLICGIIITCVSFLGFLGALKENRCLLLTFFLVLFLLMVVELALACLMLVKNEEIVNGVKGDLIAGLDSAKKKNSTQESEWDLVQKNFKCCGVNNYTDWGNNIPKSCCRDECDELPFQSYTMGCFVALSEWFEDNYLYCGIGVISICIVEVLGMCFAVTLFCHITSSGLGYKL